MKTFFQKVFTVKFVRNIIFVAILFVVFVTSANYLNNTLILTLKKNYVFQVLTEDDSSLLTLHTKLNDLRQSQINTNNRLHTLEKRIKKR